jgi:hypothetical protein
MDWTVIVGTLGGTALGAAATITQNYVNSRSQERRDQLARKDKRQELCHQAIADFLEAAQQVDEVAGLSRDRCFRRC